MTAPLSILGIGTYLPPVHDVRALVTKAGGDLTGYRGFEKACIALPDDHPSTMASQALESALREAAISPSQLKLVLSVGGARDYLPKWSLSTEVMKLHGVPSTCIGLDIMLGCTGVITGLNLTQGWLETMGGGYAAIVCGERWSETIDRANPTSRNLWAHADGGAAAVVGLGVPGGRVRFLGAEFGSEAEYNDLIVIKYGGTRNPVAPPGQNPLIRERKKIEVERFRQNLRLGYTRVFTTLRQRFPEPLHRLVCGNVSPEVVKMIAEIAGVPEERNCYTGHETGHAGACDPLLALRRLFDQELIDGPIGMAASTPSAFTAGYLAPGA